jgi:isoquinoline 1-oxidoreductase beta subunit
VESAGGITRRGFLRLSLMTGGSLALAFTLPACEGNRDAAVARQVSVWLKVSRDGRLTFVNPQAEMGQGVWSSLAMVFVDEFGGDWATTDIEAGELRPEFRLNAYVREMFTAGSTSIATGYLPVRTAAAAAREMFLAAGAARLGVPAAELSLLESRVRTRDGRNLGIGDLVDDVLKLQPPAKPQLKDIAQLRHVGKGLAAKEVPAKVTGKAIYGIDFSLPGMLVATVKASPVHGGSVVRSNAADVEKMRGVRAVVPVPHGLAVVADTFWHAKHGADALAVDFDAGDAAQVDDRKLLERHESALQRADGVVGFDEGNALARIEDGGPVHEATYFGPLLAHAPMEPMTCCARVSADRADLWLGTQGLEYATREAARVTGLPIDKVHVHNLMLGGGFGRRYEADYPIQAATIAKAMPGTPVKVIWTREEDIQQDYYRPAVMARLRAVLGADGLPAAMLVRVSAPAIAAHNPGFAQFSKPVDITAIDGFANLHYEIANRRFEWVQTESHLKIGWWRSVGNSHNAFFKECFIDELAEAAKVDPLEYRLRMLPGEKHDATRRLLIELGRAANWGRAPKGRVQGLAMHDTFGTMVGQVVELSLSGTAIQLHRVTCAYDCGSVINPNGVDAQLRGSVVWGLTAALFGEINVENGRVRQSNFHDYPLLTLSQTPAVDLVPVLRGGPPSGIGEPGVPPVSPALANALYRATGKRIRRLPLSKAGFSLAARAG